jgi:hypothetical protein
MYSYDWNIDVTFSENSNLTKDALAKHTADLQSIAGISQEASVHSFALSNSQFACAPSVLSVPQSTTTAKISIAYAPPSESIKRVLDVSGKSKRMLALLLMFLQI